MSTKTAKSASSKDDRPPSRRSLREAQRFLKDCERLKKRQRKKLKEEEHRRLDEAFERVRGQIGERSTSKDLAGAVSDLDKLMDEVLGFARKNQTREFFESIGIAVLIAVLLRAFVIEAFKIPSGSMIPTLEVGDHIFVNKFIYGLRVPLTNKWFVEWASPQRGEVIVFRFPIDPSKDYIKRVVAVAGDRVRVVGKDVFLNGQRLKRDPPEMVEFFEDAEPGARFAGMDVPRKAFAYPENSLGGTQPPYTVLYNADRRARDPFPSGGVLPGLDCSTGEPGAPAECTVKPGYVFCMGDNRDNSHDGRSWGGVPIENVKGKAMFVWWSRGQRSGIRWHRIGTPIR